MHSFIQLVTLGQMLYAIVTVSPTVPTFKEFRSSRSLKFQNSQCIAGCGPKQSCA